MTHKKNNLCSILVILAIGSLASCTKESFEINDLKRESSTKLISPRVSSEDIGVPPTFAPKVTIRTQIS